MRSRNMLVAQASPAPAPLRGRNKLRTPSQPARLNANRDSSITASRGSQPLLEGGHLHGIFAADLVREGGRL